MRHRNLIQESSTIYDAPTNYTDTLFVNPVKPVTYVDPLIDNTVKAVTTTTPLTTTNPVDALKKFMNPESISQTQTSTNQENGVVNNIVEKGKEIVNEIFSSNGDSSKDMTGVYIAGAVAAIGILALIFKR